MLSTERMCSKAQIFSEADRRISSVRFRDITSNVERYHQYIEGYLVQWRDFISTVEIIIITLEEYYQFIGGILSLQWRLTSVHWRDTISTLEGYRQCIEGYLVLWRLSSLISI